MALTLPTPQPATGDPQPTAAQEPVSMPTLNPGQEAALLAMQEFLADTSAQFFLLEGSAGTGKTFCIRALADRIRGRLVFTAPTNKATKVLRESVTTDDYKPECRTIYSLLGLTLQANGSVKELAVPEDPIDLSKFVAVVVDEASMVNSVLWDFIQRTANGQRIKFIFMGDAAQLPPVGEKLSPVWDIEHKSCLTQTMRFDNALLDLATRLREAQSRFIPTVKVEANNDGVEGVWMPGKPEFTRLIQEAAARGEFTAGSAKAIAWRNVTVDKLNELIRKRIFDGPVNPWLVDDRVILLEPAKNVVAEGEIRGLVGGTDDEGLITRVDEDYHPQHPHIKCYRLKVTFDDNRLGELWVPVSPVEVKREADRIAEQAKFERRLWKDFWAFKESFHSVRHAYAITAHRAQGSTYDTAFVDYRDILLNRNLLEAYQCLYVAATRPRKKLFLG